MAVRYNKLWKILIDKKMRKKDLQEAAHITHYQMMKLARDENITILPIVGSLMRTATVWCRTPRATVVSIRIGLI